MCAARGRAALTRVLGVGAHLEALFSPTHPFLPHVAPHFSHISPFILVFTSRRVLDELLDAIDVTDADALTPYLDMFNLVCELTDGIAPRRSFFLPTHPFLPYVAPHFSQISPFILFVEGRARHVESRARHRSESEV